MFTRFSRAALLVAMTPVLLAVRDVRPTGQVTGRNGEELFLFYCASCHGPDGKGNGPTAVVFKMQPTDLTTIAKRNDGVFPTAQVTDVVAGPDNLFIPAHGSSQMPVWGPIFRALDPSGDNKRRIAQLVKYLESIQTR